MNQTLRVSLVTFLLVVLLGAASAAVWLWLEDRPVEAAAPARFHVAPGEALSVTADRLAQAGQVRNPLVFRLWFQFGIGGGKFPSGTFQIPPGLTARNLALWFSTAQPLQVRVTIPEGWTASKIARLLEEKGVVSASAFLDTVAHPETIGESGQGLATLEGRLFPDTYYFGLDQPAPTVAAALVKTFRERTAAWASWPADQFAARLALASVVEREYRRPEEAPLIASVFQNRLDRGIPLGSCATIEYILTEVMGRPHPKRIFFVHTQIESPFNTYLHKGLPPAPIANPGLTALRAAFETPDTNYLYFVVKDPAAGTHTFSQRYEQHEQAREAYLSTYVTKG